MQIMLQLNPPLPLITPQGKALAHVLIDYGAEMDLLWVCFQEDTGEVWTWQNRDVQAQNNATFKRTVSAKPKL